MEQVKENLDLLNAERKPEKNTKDIKDPQKMENMTEYLQQDSQTLTPETVVTEVTHPVLLIT